MVTRPAQHALSGERGEIIVFLADFASRYPDSLAGMSHLTVSQQSSARPPVTSSKGWKKEITS
jgi:hypothetical protein